MSAMMEEITSDIREKRRREGGAFRAVMIAVLIVIVVGLGWLAVRSLSGEKSREGLQASLNQQSTQIADMNDRIKQVCRGTAQKDAPSLDTCEKAERNELPSAPPPAPGIGPSADQIYRGLIDYCSTRNQCRGSDGRTPDFNSLVQTVRALIPNPADGSNGKDAPAVTSDQLTATVASYCGQTSDPCRGATGPAGKDGVDGKNGTDGKDGKDGENGLSTTEVRTNLNTCTTTTTFSDGTQQATPIPGCTPS
jgi:hypothetical protein